MTHSVIDVYCVRSPEGWLFDSHDALVVYLAVEDAVENATEDGVEITGIYADTITRKLEKGEMDVVHLVLGEDKHYLVTLTEWRDLLDLLEAGRRGGETPSSTTAARHGVSDRGGG